MSSFDIMNSLHRILALYPHVRPYVTKHDILQCDLFLPPPKPHNLSHVTQHQETRAALKSSSDAK